MLGLFIVSLCAINLKKKSPNDGDYPAERLEVKVRTGIDL